MDKINLPPIISVENISKKYFFANHHQKASAETEEQYSFWALKEVSFSLNKGDTLGIIGSNGSGKTTLLKILSQATTPSIGKVIQYGKLIPIIDIGSGFHPDLSGRENIFLYGTVILGMKRSDINDNLDKIIEFSELGTFIDEPIKNYSNGMYLRLALSVALFCELDVLLMDEIFSVGDSAFMLKSYDKMSQIIKQAATVILASHNMGDIMRICNKCLWLEKGRIKMLGNTNEVISAYMESNEHLAEGAHMLESLALNSNKQWTKLDAPQAREFLVSSLSVRNEGRMDAQTEIDYNLPIVIEIEYDKIEAGCEIGFCLILADHYNNSLLITANRFHVEDAKIFYGTKGRFRYGCTIPAQLLNLGIYKINLEVSLNGKQLLQVSEVLTFRVISDIKAQADILKKHPIKFVPTLPWQIDQLG